MRIMMMFSKAKSLCCVLLILFAMSTQGQTLQSDAAARKDIWPEISRYFTSPAEFQGEYVDYR